MKTLGRNIVAELLGLLGRVIIAKYRPKVLMVTGSVGKTTTKDAVSAVLRDSFYLRASEKSYNSEFGVPLTIIGAKNPWNNFWKWLAVIKEAFSLVLLPNHYPKLLILEVGADRPGDLARILRIVTPDVVIVTHLPDVPVHVEAYASPSAVRDEEFAPALRLSPESPLIISADDEHARARAEKTRASISTFGFSEDADVRLEEPRLWEENGEPAGMQAVIHVGKKTYPLRVSGALGRPQLYAPSAAFAAAEALGIAPKKILEGLAHYTPPPGRSRLLSGMRGSLIIDDSYNASPAAVREGLKGLCLLEKSKKRIAVLGDMLELGRFSAEEHRAIGTLAASCADELVTVGIRARAIAQAAEEAGMDESKIRSFDTSGEAAAHLKSSVGQGDAVLVKGSQSVRTERVVYELLANPDDWVKLVRQEPEWQLIK